MGFKKVKAALITVGVVSIGVTAIGAVYLKRNKVQIIINTANWSYETPNVITESIELSN